MLQVTVALAFATVLAGIEPVKVPNSKSAAETVQAGATASFTLKFAVELAASAACGAGRITSAKPIAMRRRFFIFPGFRFATLCRWQMGF